MEMEQSRPLDALNKSRNKKVLVELKNGKSFTGKLHSFDIHIKFNFGPFQSLDINRIT